MKIPQEFTFSSKDNGQPNIIITGCNGMDIIANITYLIHYVYGRTKSTNPEFAEAFRATLTKTIIRADSPVWEDVKDTPGATEIFFTIPREQEEHHGSES